MITRNDKKQKKKSRRCQIGNVTKYEWNITILLLFGRTTKQRNSRMCAWVACGFR